MKKKLEARRRFTKLEFHPHPCRDFKTYSPYSAHRLNEHKTIYAFQNTTFEYNDG